MDDKNKTRGQIPSQQPQAGFGSLVKEHGPIAAGGLRPSGIEPEIHRELEQIGVKSVPEFPKVGPEERKVGIEPAGESVPVEPSGIVHPSVMTEEEARLTLKHAKPTESRFGLATLIVKFFKSIHHKLLTSKN